MKYGVQLQYQGVETGILLFGSCFEMGQTDVFPLLRSDINEGGKCAI
jgi:hypothetical protein